MLFSLHDHSIFLPKVVLSLLEQLEDRLDKRLIGKQIAEQRVKRRPFVDTSKQYIWGCVIFNRSICAHQHFDTFALSQFPETYITVNR